MPAKDIAKPTRPAATTVKKTTKNAAPAKSAAKQGTTRRSLGAGTATKATTSGKTRDGQPAAVRARTGGQPAKEVTAKQPAGAGHPTTPKASHPNLGSGTARPPTRTSPPKVEPAKQVDPHTAQVPKHPTSGPNSSLKTAPPNQPNASGIRTESIAQGPPKTAHGSQVTNQPKAGNAPASTKTGAKPEPKPDSKPQGQWDGKPGANPKPMGHGQTPSEWTGPTTPGGKPAPSKPTGEYDVPVHRIVRWPGQPAPPEGSKSGGTSEVDQARARGAGERQGPPGHKWDAGHERPASQTPPGERPYLRPEGRSENRAGGRGIAQENVVRRQDPSHKDPASKNYTREPKPKAPEPKPKAPEPKPKAPEPKSGTPEPKSGTPEPKPGTPELHLPGAPKVPGGPGAIERLAGKASWLGLIGDFMMVRDVAKELEWMSHPSDPKWGNERTDMFGQTWYRHGQPGDVFWTTLGWPIA
jgi:hypothetical protein